MGAAQSTRKITLVDDEKAGVIKLSESLAQRLRGQIEGQHAALSERVTPAAAPEPVSPSPPPAVASLSPSQIPEPYSLEPPKVPDVLPFVPEPLAPKPVPRGVSPEPEPQAPGTPPSSVVEVPMPKPPELKLPIPQQVEVTAPDVDVAIRAGPGPTLVQPGGSIPPWSIYAEEAHLMVMRLREEKEQEIKKLNQAWREKMDSREQEFAKISGLSEEQVSSALKEVESLFMKASCTPVCQNQQEAVMNCYQDHPRQSLRCAREVEHFTQCVDLSRLQSIMKQEAH
ncbi:hypothetical protein SK128_007741 [Halocaridina rubra]|uniref:MICOS complex subunit MIC19 n=1 Tax=Halocaridina rubra TaxID=373956 RepID=A0AAN8X1Z3_HALRR